MVVKKQYFGVIKKMIKKLKKQKKNFFYVINKKITSLSLSIELSNHYYNQKIFATNSYLNVYDKLSWNYLNQKYDN